MGCLILLSVIGGLIFKTIEAPVESSVVQKVQNKRSQVVSNIQQAVTRSYVEQTVESYQEEFLIAISHGIQYKDGKPETIWTLRKAIYFCITTYTNVGYGDFAPKSDLGRICCIIYAGISIPLSGIVLEELGGYIMSVLLVVWHIIHEIIQSFHWFANGCRKIKKDKSRNNPRYLQSFGFWKPRTDNLNMCSESAFDFKSSTSSIDRSKRKKTGFGLFLSACFLGGPFRHLYIRNLWRKLQKRARAKSTTSTPYVHCSDYSPPKDLDMIEIDIEYDKNHSSSSEAYRYMYVTNDSNFNNPASTADEKTDIVAPSGAGKEEKEKEEDELPGLLHFCMLSSYIAVGSWVLQTYFYDEEQELDFLKGVWFITISLTTIGYGDVVPKDKTTHMYYLPYLFIGQCLMGNVINYMTGFFNEVVEGFKISAKTIGELVANKQAAKLVKKKRNNARRKWGILRKNVNEGRIPKQLIEESNAYKAELMAVERDFVRRAYRIYFYEVFKTKAQQDMKKQGKELKKSKPSKSRDPTKSRDPSMVSSGAENTHAHFRQRMESTEWLYVAWWERFLWWLRRSYRRGKYITVKEYWRAVQWFRDNYEEVDRDQDIEPKPSQPPRRRRRYAPITSRYKGKYGRSAWDKMGN